MSPSTITQIHALPHVFPRSTPSSPRGTSIHLPKFTSSLLRRPHPLRGLNPRPLTAVGPSPAAARWGGAAPAGVISCLFGSSARASTSGAEFVKKTVSSGDIVVFSKSYCPYCATVKSIFKKMDKDISVIELDERADRQDIQDALSALVGRQTVPQVFVKGEHIGGCDDTMEAYQNGRLAKLLASTQ